MQEGGNVMRRIGILLMLAAASRLSVLAGEGRIIQPDVLRADPGFRAERLGPVPIGSVVEILEQDGNWVQVTLPEPATGTTEVTGWVRLLNVHVFEQDDHLSVVSDSAYGADSELTVATAVRGIDVERIGRANADYNALAAVSGYAASGEDARRFAADGGLTHEPE